MAAKKRSRKKIDLRHLSSLNIGVPPSTDVPPESEQLPQDQPDSSVQEPDTTSVQQPDESLTQQPEESLAQPPEESLAQPPKESLAQPPEESLAQPPEESLAQPPEESLAQQPEESLAQQPEESLAQPPDKSLARKPSKSSVQEPSQNLVQQPDESLAQQPRRISVRAEGPREETSQQDSSKPYRVPYRPEVRKLQTLSSATNASGEVFNSGDNIWVRAPWGKRAIAQIVDFYQDKDGSTWTRYTSNESYPGWTWFGGCMRVQGLTKAE